MRRRHRAQDHCALYSSFCTRSRPTATPGANDTVIAEQFLRDAIVETGSKVKGRATQRGFVGTNECISSTLLVGRGWHRQGDRQDVSPCIIVYISPRGVCRNEVAIQRTTSTRDDDYWLNKSRPLTNLQATHVCNVMAPPKPRGEPF